MTQVLFPELLGMAAIVAVGSILLTWLVEAVPTLWFRARPPPTAVRTTEIVNDWFIGQWAWLLGFAWWTALLALYSKQYFNLFSLVWSWWLLCAILLVGYFGCVDTLSLSLSLSPAQCYGGAA